MTFSTGFRSNMTPRTSRNRPTRRAQPCLGAVLWLCIACGEKPPPLAPPVVPVLVPTKEVAKATELPQTLNALLLRIEGTAEVRRAGSSEWVTLKVGEPVQEGDALRTSSNGSLKLTIGS